jgi:hypothetical protein
MSQRGVSQARSEVWLGDLAALLGLNPLIDRLAPEADVAPSEAYVWRREDRQAKAFTLKGTLGP